MTIAELVLEKLRDLPPDKQKEVLDYVESLQHEAKPSQQRISVEGLWANDGFDITEQDIAEARREMWGNYPKDIS